MKKFLYIISILFIYIILNRINTAVPAFSGKAIAYDSGEDEFYKNKIYSNQVYKVILRYPKKWSPDLSFGSIDNIPLKFYGENGYFILNIANSGAGLDGLIKNEVENNTLAYGSSPRIDKINHKGNEAVLILPSDDQNPSMKQQSAFIVKYPKSIEIDNNKYEYLILYSDKNNIRNIVDTLILLK